MRVMTEDWVTLEPLLDEKGPVPLVVLRTVGREWSERTRPRQQIQTSNSTVYYLEIDQYRNNYYFI
jgi:hypothetical protein